jgi:hypothetical protein
MAVLTGPSQKVPGSQRDLLLDVLDRAWDVRSWHGTNLRGSIRGVRAEEAAWRPGPGRHNIHELVVHAAYWKYVARRRMLGERRGSFPLKGSDWFSRPEAGVTEEQWNEDVALLAEMHDSLREAVASLPEKRLREPAQKGFDNVGLITGIAAHDLYHAGQIQLLKRLYRSAES